MVVDPRRGSVSPGAGGCWFCWVKDDDLVFDTEFDTFVHVKCIEEALAREPDHPEAECMRYLLPDYNLPAVVDEVMGIPIVADPRLPPGMVQVKTPSQTVTGINFQEDEGW